MKQVISLFAFFLALCANAQWTVVNLHPAGATESRAYGVHGGQQVGFAIIGGVWRPGLWTGTTGSWVDLTPAGGIPWIGTAANGVGGGQQVGLANVAGAQRASLWKLENQQSYSHFLAFRSRQVPCDDLRNCRRAELP